MNGFCCAVGGGSETNTRPTVHFLLLGVTRDSIIQLARQHGYEVLEEKVAVSEAMEVSFVSHTC